MKSKYLMIGAAVCAALFLFSGIMLCRQYADGKQATKAFEQVAALVETEPAPADTPPETEPLPELTAFEKYRAVQEQNSDFVGWLSVPGTNIDYPVMQTVDEPNFYLKRGFDKQYSDYGVPYVQENCDIALSDNCVIYGHHMNDGSMFNVISDTTDQATFDSIEYVYYITRDATYKLRPLATKVVEDTYAKARTTNFEGDDGLKNYLSEMLDGASAVASDATDRAASATKVVTLVTCRSLSLSNTRAVMVLTPVEE